MTFAYLGPDTFLPITSVAAIVVGGLMMMGRNSWRFIANLFRNIMKK